MIGQLCNAVVLDGLVEGARQEYASAVRWFRYGKAKSVLDDLGVRLHHVGLSSAECEKIIQVVEDECSLRVFKERLAIFGSLVAVVGGWSLWRWMSTPRLKKRADGEPEILRGDISGYLRCCNEKTNAVLVLPEEDGVRGDDPRIIRVAVPRPGDDQFAYDGLVPADSLLGAYKVAFFHAAESGRAHVVVPLLGCDRGWSAEDSLKFFTQAARWLKSTEPALRSGRDGSYSIPQIHLVRNDLHV